MLSGWLAAAHPQAAVLEAFYSRLCRLVQAQRISDPLSLMLVHKVHALMEEGVQLRRPLLVQVRAGFRVFGSRRGRGRRQGWGPAGMRSRTHARWCAGGGEPPPALCQCGGG